MQFSNRAVILMVIRSLLGKPYKWGGDDTLEGFDCSGFVQEVLASVGLKPKGDNTAHMLHLYFLRRDKGTLLKLKDVKFGTLLFYGTSGPTVINHCAIALNKDLCVEAGGGDSTVLNKKDAADKNAYIRIRPIYNRRDFFCAIHPFDLR